MEPKYLMKTDVQLNPNISRKKKKKKYIVKKHQNNECLLVVAMYHFYNRFIRKNWNFRLSFRYFHFSSRSGTFLLDVDFYVIPTGPDCLKSGQNRANSGPRF